MTVTYDSHRGWPSGSHPALALEDKFEIVKEIGDGSFGSVCLGRTRSAGAHLVRRGTMVGRAILLSPAPTHTATGCHQDDEEDI